MHSSLLYIGFLLWSPRIKIFFYSADLESMILLIIKHWPSLSSQNKVSISLSIIIDCHFTLLLLIFLTCPFWHANGANSKKESFLKSAFEGQCSGVSRGGVSDFESIACKTIFSRFSSQKNARKATFVTTRKKEKKSTKFVMTTTWSSRTTDGRANERQKPLSARVDLKVCEVTLVLEILCCSSLMIGSLAGSPF